MNMGKKARKTRWRTLAIEGENSDSEESNANLGVRIPKSYQHKTAYYEKFNYSSQSSPRRKYQYDSSSKSTRSSSTTSENKITFNEDEYTRITTPRQDVLFKKGYLNKPKNYQTQTSTGTSTNSTGNSTGNGTPDYQSTDLEYDSQFIFPNGFLDQNGIYYVNSYEPYPLMIYNPSTYYHECNGKSKRYSTGSLTESMSPNNEEVTSQDLSQSGGEASNSVSDYGGHPVYNVVYPSGYYVNGVCTPETVNGHYQSPDSPKRMKKRRRRKSTSKSQTVQEDTSEYSDEYDSSDETKNTNHTQETTNSNNNHHSLPSTSISSSASTTSCTSNEETTKIEDEVATIQESKDDETIVAAEVDSNVTEINHKESLAVPVEVEDLSQKDESICIPKEESNSSDTKTENIVETNSESSSTVQQKYDLKPDAEEFIPRAYRHTPNIDTIQAVPIKLLPPNFLPIPLMPMGEFNHAFIPPGIPISLYPNFVGYVANTPSFPTTPVTIEVEPQSSQSVPEKPAEVTNSEENVTHQENTTTKNRNTTIDIATVVSKLEVAAKEMGNESKQEECKEPEAVYTNSPSRNNKQYKPSPRYKNNVNFKRNQQYNGTSYKPHNEERISSSYVNRQRLLNEIPGSRDKVPYSPERMKRNWKQTNGSPKRQYNSSYNRNALTTDVNKQPYIKSGTGKHYSEMVKNTQTNNISADPVKNINKPNTIQLSNTSLINNHVNDNAVQLSSPLKCNQWISVSNRKKRKNKTAEETELLEESPETDSSDIFEAYDVNMLVDVIPPQNEDDPKEEHTIVITKNETDNIENIIINIAENESSAVTDNVALDIPEVSQIEKELLEEIQQPEIVVVNEEHIEPEIKDEESPVITKKKPKKFTHKPITKKVIIKDIDLSMNVEEIKPPIKKVVTKIDVNKKEETNTVKEIEVNEPELVNGSSEKKSKKKKKKSTKSAATNNGTVDDSYDFLLETTLLDETVGKTNDEISLELDRLIQKGMYGNLEDKIKSLDVNGSESFFTDIFTNHTTTSLNLTKSNYQSNSHDFNKIFQSTRHFLRPNSVSVEETSKINNIDLNKIELPASDSASNEDRTGVSVEIQERPGTPLIVDDTNTDVITDEPAKKYPITEAVKEWMTKTRETTPEIEILKSPRTIYREFCNSDSDDSEIECNQDNKAEPAKLGEPVTDSQPICVDGNSLSDKSPEKVSDAGVVARIYDDNEEEITIFSMTTEKSREGSCEQDLLDYWDNDPIVMCNNDLTIKDNGATNNTMCSQANGCAKCNDVIIEQGEDAIDIYESKYGNNATYKEIQMEIDETKKNKKAQDKLPYTRAICCSLQ